MDSDSGENPGHDDDQTARTPQDDDQQQQTHNINSVHTEGVFHLQASKLLRTPKRNEL